MIFYLTNFLKKIDHAVMLRYFFNINLILKYFLYTTITI
jgi:hypothetical protein